MLWSKKRNKQFTPQWISNLLYLSKPLTTVTGYLTISSNKKKTLYKVQSWRLWHDIPVFAHKLGVEPRPWLNLQHLGAAGNAKRNSSLLGSKKVILHLVISATMQVLLLCWWKSSRVDKYHSTRRLQSREIYIGRVGESGFIYNRVRFL